MLEQDNRFGDNRRYRIAPVGSWLWQDARMYVPDRIRKSVCFVGDGNVARGTGFFVTVGKDEDQATYLVTARHVIAGVRKKTPSGNIYLRINSRAEADGFEWIETDVAEWVYHPDELLVDVALLPLTDETVAAMHERFDFEAIPLPPLVSFDQRARFHVGLGEEVVMVGLFYRHHGRKRNVPIIRIGNVAAIPEEQVYTRVGSDWGYADALLVEARSTGGLSGSPVFWSSVQIPEHGPYPDHNPPSGRYVLIGLVHGHWDVPPDEIEAAQDEADESEPINVNMGIAQVVPWATISEVLMQPRLDKQRKDAAEERRRKDAATQDLPPDEPVTRDQFLRDLTKVTRRVEPESDQAEGER